MLTVEEETLWAMGPSLRARSQIRCFQSGLIMCMALSTECLTVRGWASRGSSAPPVERHAATCTQHMASEAGGIRAELLGQEATLHHPRDQWTPDFRPTQPPPAFLASAGSSSAPPPPPPERRNITKPRRSGPRSLDRTE